MDENCSNHGAFRVLTHHNCPLWVCVTQLLELLTKSGLDQSPNSSNYHSEPATSPGTFASLCPPLQLPRYSSFSYLPPLLSFYNRTYAAMETLTEPHTLTATLSCMIGMARSLVSPNNHYPEGRAHVLPLLIGSLPGVDPNDFSKCMVSNECVD